jgi:hypothetical protein
LSRFDAKCSEVWVTLESDEGALIQLAASTFLSASPIFAVLASSHAPALWLAVGPEIATPTSRPRSIMRSCWPIAFLPIGTLPRTASATSLSALDLARSSASFVESPPALASARSTRLQPSRSSSFLEDW